MKVFCSLQINWKQSLSTDFGRWYLRHLLQHDCVPYWKWHMRSWWMHAGYDDWWKESIRTSLCTYDYFHRICAIWIINICYSPAERSVLGETVPEVLITGTQTEGTVSPNTDRPRPVNNIFIFSRLRFKSFRKIFLHSPTYVGWSRTRSCWWSARSIAN